MLMSVKRFWLNGRLFYIEDAMKKKKSKRLTALEEIIRSLSDRIVKAQ